MSSSSYHTDDDTRRLVVAVIDFLRDQLETRTDFLPEDRDGLEISIQCLEMAYDLDPGGFSQFRYPRPLVDVFNQVTQPVPVKDKLRAEYHKENGNMLMTQSQPKEAEEEYSRAIELDKWNAIYYCNRASARIDQQHYFDGISDCRQALILNPDYAKAYARMGQAYALIRRPREAARCFSRAVELEPDNERYQNNLRMAQTQIQGTSTIDIFETLLNSLFGSDFHRRHSSPNNTSRVPFFMIISAESHPAIQQYTESNIVPDTDDENIKRSSSGERKIQYPTPYGVASGISNEEKNASRYTCVLDKSDESNYFMEIPITMNSSQHETFTCDQENKTETENKSPSGSKHENGFVESTKGNTVDMESLSGEQKLKTEKESGSQKSTNVSNQTNTERPQNNYDRINNEILSTDSDGGKGQSSKSIKVKTKIEENINSQINESKNRGKQTTPEQNLKFGEQTNINENYDLNDSNGEKTQALNDEYGKAPEYNSEKNYFNLKEKHFVSAFDGQDVGITRKDRNIKTEMNGDVSYKNNEDKNKKSVSRKPLENHTTKNDSTKASASRLRTLSSDPIYYENIAKNSRSKIGNSNADDIGNSSTKTGEWLRTRNSNEKNFSVGDKTSKEMFMDSSEKNTSQKSQEKSANVYENNDKLRYERARKEKEDRQFYHHKKNSTANQNLYQSSKIYETRYDPSKKIISDKSNQIDKMHVPKIDKKYVKQNKIKKQPHKLEEVLISNEGNSSKGENSGINIEVQEENYNSAGSQEIDKLENKINRNELSVEKKNGESNCNRRDTSNGKQATVESYYEPDAKSMKTREKGNDGKRNEYNVDFVNKINEQDRNEFISKSNMKVASKDTKSGHEKASRVQNSIHAENEDDWDNSNIEFIDDIENGSGTKYEKIVKYTKNVNHENSNIPKNKTNGNSQSKNSLKVPNMYNNSANEEQELENSTNESAQNKSDESCESPSNMSGADSFKQGEKND